MQPLQQSFKFVSLGCVIAALTALALSEFINQGIAIGLSVGIGMVISRLCEKAYNKDL